MPQINTHNLSRTLGEGTHPPEERSGWDVDQTWCWQRETKYASKKPSRAQYVASSCVFLLRLVFLSVIVAATVH